MILRKARRGRCSGQSAAELAIFGSIVIFVIGLILKATLSVSSDSNMSLRAFRRALHESYVTANGDYAGQFSAARNQASILMLEDRLSIDPSKKMGSRDRFPLMAQGSGTMTHSMFMSTDPDDPYDVSVFDLFVNGQRFPLSTSLYHNVNFAEKRASGEIPDCVDPPGPALSYGPKTGVCYDTAEEEYIFFRTAYNGENKGEPDGWCDDLPGGTPCDAKWPADHRFDLDFDGTPDIVKAAHISINGNDLRNPDGTPMLMGQRFGWQWVRVEGTKDELYEGLKVDIDGDLQEETIEKCNFKEKKFSKIFSFLPGGNANSKELINCWVVDNQEGDFDSTINEGTKARYEAWRTDYKTANPSAVDPGPFQDPGLGRDMTMYSFTGDGTALRLEEGKLYTGDGQFVRSSTSNDHVDIIERVLRLSNDTGRFCTKAGAKNGTPCKGSPNCVPTNWTLPNWARRQGVYGMDNPVEACGNCFSIVGGVDHHKLTCMETDGPVIFVRSRIRDQRKRKWITETEKR